MSALRRAWGVSACQRGAAWCGAALMRGELPAADVGRVSTMSKALGRCFLLLMLVILGLWFCRGFTLAWQQTTPAQPVPIGSVTAQAALSRVPAGLPSNVQAFVVLALPFARQAHQALGWQTSVILAQWGLEHGWVVPDSQGFNWGNTTYAPDCVLYGGFCYASTPTEGLREYFYTARLPWYQAVTQAAHQGAVDLFVCIIRFLNLLLGLKWSDMSAIPPRCKTQVVL
jgi:hypothetical protein